MNDWLNELNRDRPPADVVPGEGLTRADLLRMNSTVGKPVTGTVPGEVMLDLDGIPNAVEPARKVTSIFGGAQVTRAQLAAAGLTPHDVPNLHVTNTEGTSHV